MHHQNVQRTFLRLPFFGAFLLGTLIFCVPEVKSQTCVADQSPTASCSNLALTNLSASINIVIPADITITPESTAEYNYPGVQVGDVLSRSSIFNISNYGSILSANSGLEVVKINYGETTFTNNGSINGGLELDSQRAYGVSIQNGATLNLINNGTIQNATQYGVNNSGTLSLDNSGTISSAVQPIFNSGTINSIVNRGTIKSTSGYWGIENSFKNRANNRAPWILRNIHSLANAQGAGNAAGQLTYQGNLPNNYYTIINNPSNYGQISFSSDASTFTQVLTFGIYTGSIVSNGTYAAVLSGLTSDRIVASSTSGSYQNSGTSQNFIWNLVNRPDTTIWDLVFSTAVSSIDILAGVGVTNNLSSVGTSLNAVFNGGTLIVDNDNDNAVTNSATFRINYLNGTIDQNGKTATFTGAITNSGTGVDGKLTIINTGTAGSGSVTLSGNNTYSGGTEVQAGANLSISSASNIGTGTLALVGSSIVPAILTTTADMTITNSITVSGDPEFNVASNRTSIESVIQDGISSGDVVVTGGGTLVLTEENTYTGATTINSGTTLALSGSGAIATSSGLTNNGTFNTTGKTGNVSLANYTQSASGTLAMNMSATNNQQMNVSNTATLAGNLAITASAGSYNVGRYTLITASNGVNGTFNTFDGSALAALSADYSNYALGYDANHVYLNLYPTAANTQASIERNLSAIRGAYSLANIVMNNNLNQDCTFFNEHGFCASFIASHTNLAGSNISDTTNGILVLAKKMSEHVHLGAYLDQTININNSNFVSLRNDGPGVGGFAVWNHQADGFGPQLRASVGHSSKDLNVTRQIVGNAEAGTGKTNLDSYGAAIVASYAVKATDSLNVTPYAGVRWTKVSADGYTEDSTAFAPLNFAALSQSATTLMGGLKVNKAINQQAAAYASFALEQDLHNNTGSYAASSTNIAGITPIAFNQDINKTRPVVSAGMDYTIDLRQRIGADVIWSEQALTNHDSTTLMVRYILGL
jgi:autotransporter-associated beta strand protein